MQTFLQSSNYREVAATLDYMCLKERFIFYTMSRPKCSVDWCDNTTRIKGFCQKHYDQMYRYGEVRPDIERPKICSFPDCGRKVCAKGLCNTHWAQMDRHGKLWPIITEETLEERFWRFVQKGENDDDCWLWLGPETGKFAVQGKQGYGQLSWRGNKWMAHRVSYTLFRGELPDAIQLDHLCRNRMCVNPDHLDPVTLRQNVQRMHAYWAMVGEINRLRSLVISLGGNPGADVFTIHEFCSDGKES